LVIHGPDLVISKLSSITPSLEILSLYNANDQAFDGVRQTADRLLTLLRDEQLRLKARQESKSLITTSHKDVLVHSGMVQRKAVDLAHLGHGKFGNVGDESPVTPSKRKSLDVGNMKIGLSSPPKKMSCDLGPGTDLKESMTESLGTTPIKLKALKFNKMGQEASQGQADNKETGKQIHSENTSNPKIVTAVNNSAALDNKTKELDLLDMKDNTRPIAESDEFGDFVEHTTPKPSLQSNRFFEQPQSHHQQQSLATAIQHDPLLLYLANEDEKKQKKKQAFEGLDH
jgi:hypothetical protein